MASTVQEPKQVQKTGKAPSRFHQPCDRLEHETPPRLGTLVLEADQTTSELGEQFMVASERAGAKILGAVLNRHERYIPKRVSSWL